MSIQHFIRCFVVLVGAMVAVGCSHTYTPQILSDFDFDRVPAFSGKNNDVTVVNVQTSTEPVKFCQNGFHAWYANLQECTGVVVDTAKRELGNRGLRVTDNAARSLKLTVTSMNFSIGWVELAANVQLEVQTGDGYAAKYTALGQSWMAGNVLHQTNAALSNAVVEMLRDKKIVSYLTGIPEAEIPAPKH